MTESFYALVFPCRKDKTEWVDASTKKHTEIEPKHWQKLMTINVES